MNGAMLNFSILSVTNCLLSTAHVDMIALSHWN